MVSAEFERSSVRYIPGIDQGFLSILQNTAAIRSRIVGPSRRKSKRESQDVTGDRRQTEVWPKAGGRRQDAVGPKRKISGVRGCNPRSGAFYLSGFRLSCAVVISHSIAVLCIGRKIAFIALGVPAERGCRVIREA